MAEPLSVDLRKRVVAAIKGGMSRRGAAAHFQVGVSSAIRWAAQVEKSGDLSPKPQGGDRRSPRLHETGGQTSPAQEAGYVPNSDASTGDSYGDPSGGEEPPLEKAVGPVRIVLKVGRVSTWVAAPVLGQEDAVGGPCPARAGTTNVIGTEPCGKPTFPAGTSGCPPRNGSQ